MFNMFYDFFKLILLIIFYGLLINYADCLRHLRVSVPDAIEVGDKIVLKCTYDLQGEPLYTLKWYRGEQEFYRYTPNEIPSIKIFTVAGLPELNVLKDESNSSQVVIKHAKLKLSGQYSCEVTTDAPSFQAQRVSAEMKVVVLPKEIQQMKEYRQRYHPGEQLSILCISSNTNPAANLTWIVNDMPLDNKYVKEYSIDIRRGDLQDATSRLIFKVTDRHFHENNNCLKIRCTASIYSIYYKIKEVCILPFDKPVKHIYRPEIRKSSYDITALPDVRDNNNNMFAENMLRKNAENQGVYSENSAIASHSKSETFLFLLVIIKIAYYYY